jgi:hypothetical protein
MEKFKETYEREYGYLCKQYSSEMQDIQNSIKEKRIFTGEVRGIVKINFIHQIPNNFQLIHLNRALLGIFAIPDKPEGKTLSFNFNNTSIFKFLCEFEYIRAYCKYKELKIESIELDIKSLLPKIKEKKEDDLQIISKEWEDIDRSLGILRLFSSPIPLRIDYEIEYEDLNLTKNGSGDFNSIYGVFAEISGKREFRKTVILENIKLKISNLEDSNIIVYEDIFERRDQESLEVL